MYITFIILALVIISGLAFYAGSLLFKLKSQQQQREKNIQHRIERIIESIQTIAKAMAQQQCNLSEGSIRLFHLLEGLPVLDKPDFSQQFPGLYKLYEEVKDLPTHQERKAQSKQKTKQQDIQREEKEAQLESKILAEVETLKAFSI